MIKPRKRPIPPEGGTGFGDRCAAAFVAAFVSGPPLLFGWWLLNFKLPNAPVGFVWFEVAFAAFVVFAFAFPRALPTVFGKMLEFLFGVSQVP